MDGTAGRSQLLKLPPSARALYEKEDEWRHDNIPCDDRMTTRLRSRWTHSLQFILEFIRFRAAEYDEIQLMAYRSTLRAGSSTSFMIALL
jgi:hypothetical protein